MMTELEQILWIKQVRDFGLGNMITMTPGLREMSARLGKRIPVYFETEGLSGLFADCPFIDVLAGPIKHCAPKCTSWKPDRLPGESDYMAWSRILNIITPEYCPENVDFDPYVDACEPPQWWEHPKGKTIAIAHGCLSESRVTIAQKDVGAEVLERMVDAVCEAGATPVIIGNAADDVKYWRHCDINTEIIESTALAHPDITLRRTVGIMQKCDAFITNATGLAHVGAASGMTGLVLWRDCDFEKNVMPSRHIEHIDKMKNQTYAINKFVKRVMA